MASESTSYSYTGIPLVGAPTEVPNYAANYGLGMPVQPGGPGSMIPGQPTAAAGILGQDMAGIAGLYGLQPPSGLGGAIGGINANSGAMTGIASSLNGQVSGNLDYANKALQDAFDPQKQAYNYYLQQALSTAGAQEAQGGYAGSPYGAEVTGATAANFGNNWQTAQIGRENTGMQTATGLQNANLGYQTSAANIFNQAGNLDQAAASDYLQQYGLQGANMAAALGALTSLFSDMKVSTGGSQSSSGGNA